MWGRTAPPDPQEPKLCPLTSPLWVSPHYRFTAPRGAPPPGPNAPWTLQSEHQGAVWVGVGGGLNPQCLDSITGLRPAVELSHTPPPVRSHTSKHGGDDGWKWSSICGETLKTVLRFWDMERIDKQIRSVWEKNRVMKGTKRCKK